MLKNKIGNLCENLKEKTGNLGDTLYNLFRKSNFGHILTGVAHFGGPVLPAICLGALVVTTLYGYQKPEAAAYSVASSGDIVIEVPTNSSAENDAVEENSTQEQATGCFDLEDGVYRGTGIGYGGNVVVDVTIASQSITQIEVVDSSGETSSFFSKATAVIDAIIATQSTDVDVISGATYSSNGIISAVKNALTGEEATGTTATASASSSSGSTSVGTVSESGTYKDGTYIGSAQGFGGTIKVQVTIKNSKIKSISVLSASGETSSYLSKAKAVLTSIVSKQSTNVDTVSGATYSSAGLIKAVRNALSKASTSSSSSSSSKKKKKSSSTTTAKKTETSHSAGAATTGGLPYDDGTYYGTGSGWGGTTKVAVTIKDKKITTITIVSHEDTDSYFEKAKSGLLPQVISQQNTNVDVVSGATYSSEGILEAIDNALAAAKAATSNNSGSSTDSSTESTTENKADSTTSDSSESTTETKELIYKNGTYSASAECVDTDYDEFEYTVTVTLTLENDVITDLTVTTTDDGSNSSYISRATNGTSKYTGVKQQIMANGGTEGVDVVSGATFSSNAIINAAQSALDQAKN